MRVTWLIHICDMTHTYVWHDTFICVTCVWQKSPPHKLYASCHTYECDMTYLCVGHDWFMWVTWSIYGCETKVTTALCICERCHKHELNEYHELTEYHDMRKMTRTMSLHACLSHTCMRAHANSRFCSLSLSTSPHTPHKCVRGHAERMLHGDTDRKCKFVYANDTRDVYICKRDTMKLKRDNYIYIYKHLTCRVRA